MTRSNSILSASLVGLALGAACPYSYATDHCANADGDAYCAEAYPDGSRAFCARGLDECGEQAASDGCVEARPKADACYSPCGGGKSLAEDPECEGAAEGTSSSDTVTMTDARRRDDLRGMDGRRPDDGPTDDGGRGDDG